MTLRCLSGFALCLGLAGCTRLSPAYSESGTDGQTSTTDQPPTSTTLGSSTTPRETDTLDTQGPTGPDETGIGAETSTGLGPDPVDCSTDKECGHDFDPCPPGSTCNVYRDPQLGSLEASCLPLGSLPWGAACEPACADEGKRCGEGLVCAAWRDDPICLSRCGPGGECDATDSCFVPGAVDPQDGGCEPIQACDLLEQDCPVAGDACVATAGEPACFPSLGTGEGESCRYVNTCAAGLVCAFENPACPAGTACCMELCDQDAEPPICVCDDLGVPSQPSVGVCTTFPA